MKSSLEVPFIVKFLILGFMIWGASVIQKSRIETLTNSSNKLPAHGKDTIFTTTSVPVPLLVFPHAKSVSQKTSN